jgi:hypothetical protein
VEWFTGLQWRLPDAMQVGQSAAALISSLV